MIVFLHIPVCLRDDLCDRVTSSCSIPHPALSTTGRQSLLSLHMTKAYVRTATRTTLKVEANLTQILNFKANFHTEFELFFKKKNLC